MTTNYRRALATAVHCDLANESPRELIKQLDTLGLLAPDLPEPTIENGEPTWELGSYFGDVTIFKGMVRVGFDRTWMYGVDLDLDESEALALALLAAIKHQKENRHES